MKGVIRAIGYGLMLVNLAGCGREEPPASVPSPAATPVLPDGAQGASSRSQGGGSHALPAYREKWRRMAEANRPELAGEIVTLAWPDLMPVDYRLDRVLADYDVSGLSDTDYQAVKMLREIEAELEQAPVVRELDGQRVRLPGFALPLEYAGERVTDFLLVPYYGACIHVPPPPLNQMVYVKAGDGVKIRKLFDTVWVTGRLEVLRTDSDWGDAGYTLQADGITYMEAKP